MLFDPPQNQPKPSFARCLAQVFSPRTLEQFSPSAGEVLWEREAASVWMRVGRLVQDEQTEQRPVRA